MIPFVVFLITPSMLFPFITGKNFAFRIIVEIIFVFWAVLALREPQYRPKWSWILGVLGIFTLIVGLADAFGVNPIKSFWSNFERMEGFLGIAHLFLYFLVLSAVLKGEKLWNAFWGTWLGVTLIMCIYGFFQLAGKIRINQGGVRVDGTLGNATYLAVFLLFNIFITAFLFARSKNKKTSAWFYIPAILLELILLYHTATRGAILGLIGGALVTIALALIFSHGNKKFKKISLYSLVALLLILGTFFAVRNTTFVKNSPVLERFASISPSELKTQGRYYIWPMAVKGALERPFLGWGQENFNFIFNRDYNPKMYAQEQWFDRAHSTPLDWLVAAGFPGLISYLLIFVFALYYLWRKTDISFLEKSLFTGLLSAYFFQNIFVFDNLFSYVLFISVIAYIHSLSGKDVSLFQKNFGKLSQSAVSMVVIIGVIFSFYYFNFKPIKASRSLIAAMISAQTSVSESGLDLFEKAINESPLGRQEVREQLVLTASNFLGDGVPENLKKSYSEFTNRELQEQLRQTPDDTRYWTFYGLFLRTVGAYNESQTAFQKATSLSPNKQSLLFELGAAQILKNDFEKALETFKYAYELEPSFGQAKMNYAIAALYAGKNDLANELFSSLPEETVLNDGRVAAALVDLKQYPALVELFSRRIITGQDNLENNTGLALSYLRLGQRQKATEVLQAYIKRHPEQKGQVEPYIKEIQDRKNF